MSAFNAQADVMMNVQERSDATASTDRGMLMASQSFEVNVDSILIGEEKLYSPVEIAYILGLKQETIQEKCRTGQIAATKINAQWRITGMELKRYIQEGPNKVRGREADDNPDNR